MNRSAVSPATTRRRAASGPPRVLRRRLLLYGNSGGDPEAELTAASLRNDNLLVGGWSIMALERTDRTQLRAITAEAFALVAGGAVTLDVRHVFALSDAAEAHRLIESRESTGKVVLDICSRGDRAITRGGVHVRRHDSPAAS